MLYIDRGFVPQFHIQSSISNILYSDFHQPVPSFFRADDKWSKARLLWKSKTIEVFCVLHSVGSYCFQKNRTTAIELLEAVFQGEKLWGKMLLWLAFFFKLNDQLFHCLVANFIDSCCWHVFYVFSSGVRVHRWILNIAARKSIFIFKSLKSNDHSKNRVCTISCIGSLPVTRR